MTKAHLRIAELSRLSKGWSVLMMGFNAHRQIHHRLKVRSSVETTSHIVYCCATICEPLHVIAGNPARPFRRFILVLATWECTAYILHRPDIKSAARGAGGIYSHIRRITNRYKSNSIRVWIGVPALNFVPLFAITSTWLWQRPPPLFTS